ncbi:MAG: hypothetical protein FWC43_11735 [Planctomycetaceae bacterium]|nr:hypothetical protein [Planctomycetaceae bacterium]
MRKDDYLSSQDVRNFIAWMEKTTLDIPKGFVHRYIHVKEKKWYEFDNLFDAYKKYHWPCLNSIDIDQLSDDLRKSIEEADEHSCAETCEKILKWGGVWNQTNKKHISKLKPNFCSYLLKVRKILKSDKHSSEYYSTEMSITITSGFSKIYSALIDDYMIYDSRVAAALCFLVRSFCEQTKLPAVPEELKFALSVARPLKNYPNRRNPSNNKYQFPNINSNPQRYLENNVRANWLMSAVAKTTKSNFAGVAKPLRLRALEKALFMIGYDVSGD